MVVGSKQLDYKCYVSNDYYYHYIGSTAGECLNVSHRFSLSIISTPFAFIFPELRLSSYLYLDLSFYSLFFLSSLFFPYLRSPFLSSPLLTLPLVSSSCLTSFSYPLFSFPPLLSLSPPHFFLFSPLLSSPLLLLTLYLSLVFILLYFYFPHPPILIPPYFFPLLSSPLFLLLYSHPFTSSCLCYFFFFPLS